MFHFGAYANELNALLPKIDVGKASLLPNNLEFWALADMRQLRVKSTSAREHFNLEDTNHCAKEEEGELHSPPYIR